MEQTASILKQGPRQECVACLAQTYRDTCSTCGSMNLRPLTPSSGDLRRVGDLPLSLEALRTWRRDALPSFVRR